jgi:uncharacterized protein (DUF58 family)
MIRMDMDIGSLMARAERLAIKSRHLAQSRYAGLYKSAFRGQGMEFAETREYVEGDDVRLIDWNVSARSQSFYIKRMIEERERHVLLMLDASGSLNFGSVKQTKFDLLLELAALFILSCHYSKDKISLAIFRSKIECYKPAAKGWTHALQLIREIVLQKPSGAAADMERVWAFLNSPSIPRSLVLLLTDFQAPINAGHALAVAARKHEMLAILAADPREWALPAIGRIIVGDSETGEIASINTHRRVLRAQYEKTAAGKKATLISALEGSGIEWIEFSTGEEYESKLRRFLEARQSKRARPASHA